MKMPKAKTGAGPYLVASIILGLAGLAAQRQLAVGPGLRRGGVFFPVAQPKRLPLARRGIEPRRCCVCRH